MNQSVDFFSRQFDRQIAVSDYALNPFEQRTLPHLRGEVLELGCGLGNLTIEAARCGARVTSLDACPHAIEHLRQRARNEALAVDARASDLAQWRAERAYDCVVAIGLLMFFDCPTGYRLLEELKRATRPGGVLAVNVLVEGTTFTRMFDPAGHCLFAPDALRARLAGWQTLSDETEDFAAPDDQRKRFLTLICRRAATLN